VKARGFWPITRVVFAITVMVVGANLAGGSGRPYFDVTHSWAHDDELRRTGAVVPGTVHVELRTEGTGRRKHQVAY
jgi:hypothetical protein